MNRDAQGDLSASYSISGADFQKLLAGASRHFATKVEMMNALNVFPVPDGDTGTNMWLTLQAAVDSVNRLGDADLGRVADTAAIGALMGARGNSGVILSQFFRGMARGFSGKERASIPQVAKAFQYGVVMAYRAVSKPVEGTILTVAREMARGGKIAAKEGSTLGKLLEDAFEAGKIALERTTEQLPVLKEAGVVDSGGCGMLVLLEGFLKVAKGETIAELSEAEVYQPAEGLTDASEQKHLTYNYCTEALVKGTNLRVRRLREDLEPMGDSLIVVGDDKVAKVHIHTNHPGEVLELCLKRGTLHKIKIDNMLDQHRDTGFFKGEHAGDVDAVKTSAEEAQGVGLVVVGSGPGIEEIFRNVGANRIISGGPTMNPTVQEFVDAIRVFSNGVVILPNDKNIRLAAEQASTMVNRNVAVIPTKNIPEGIAATMAFDPQASVEENLEAMTERIQEIKSAEITFSVRDSTIGGLSLEKGDIIGIMEGKVAAAGESKEQVLLAVIEAMVEEDDGIISVIYGADVGQAEVEAIEREIKAKYPDMDTEFLSGGQPLYYFYVSVE